MKSRAFGAPGWIALSTAVVLLGAALENHGGSFAPRAAWYLVFAWLASIAAVANPALGVARARAVMLRISPTQWRTLAIAVPFYFMIDCRDAPIKALIWHRTLMVDAAIVTAALLGTCVFTLSERWSRVAFYALVGWHFAFGLWMLALSRDPVIDVFVFQRDAVRALLAGHNPYAMTFPNIYPSDIVYGPGLVREGRLQFGYPYPPLTLLLIMPAALLGDSRYAQLTAFTLAGVLVAATRNNRQSRSGAALFLCMSRGFFVLEQSWTEPLGIVFLALALWTAYQAPRALPIALGLFFASKQYLVIVAPLVILLTDRSPRRAFALVMRSAAIAMLVTVPFALWDFAAFFHSVVALQWLQPYRPDALTFLNLAGGWRSPLLAFVLLIPATALAWWRAPASPAGFTAATALVLITFFAWNKQAFCNYYFFALGALCMALAVAGPKESATA